MILAALRKYERRLAGFLPCLHRGSLAPRVSWQNSSHLRLCAGVREGWWRCLLLVVLLPWQCRGGAMPAAPGFMLSYLTLWPDAATHLLCVCGTFTTCSEHHIDLQKRRKIVLPKLEQGLFHRVGVGFFVFRGFFYYFISLFFPLKTYWWQDWTAARHPVTITKQQWVGRSQRGVAEPSLWSEDIQQMIFLGLDAKVVLYLCCMMLTGSIFNVMVALICELLYIQCMAWKSCFRRCYRRTLILLDMNR